MYVMCLHKEIVLFSFCCFGKLDITVSKESIVLCYHIIFFLTMFIFLLTKIYLFILGYTLVFYSSIGFDKYNGMFSSFSSVQLLSRVWLWDPMNLSTPGLPGYHHLPEFTQTHVHWVRDAIQPSHPLSSPFPPAPNPSQHQSFFQWVISPPLALFVLMLPEAHWILYPKMSGSRWVIKLLWLFGSLRYFLYSS